ncbi:hypothetical protein DRH27_03290 [Candidatus Falkowbacteria bacterium]|nr:MAG: hypothetical protein DRH27_03290 [Candidatus Falkowbacteria bacterium]
MSLTEQTYTQDALPTFWQPVNRETFTTTFNRVIGAPKTLSTNAVLDTYIVNLSAGHAFVANDILFMTQDGNIYQAKVLLVDVNALTMDTPLNFPYLTAPGVEGQATIVFKIENNLAVNGSATPQKFEVFAPGDHVWAVTRMFITMLTDGAPDDGLFGDLDALTRGVIFRILNGRIYNKGNFKDNGDIAAICYDLTYSQRSGPHGSHGVRARASFASAGKSGNAIILDGSKNEKAEVIVQDDLLNLVEFKIALQGVVLK